MYLELSLFNTLFILMAFKVYLRAAEIRGYDQLKPTMVSKLVDS